MTDPARAALLAALVAATASAAITGWLGGAWRRARGSARARRRAARATAGEDAAASLLERAGFAIVERQARIAWSPTLDGEALPTELRADYVVTARGERLVAEVKTGEEAPSLATAATRRQLLEYRVAFAVDGVLLVRPEHGTIHRVDFPLPEAAPPPRRAGLGLGVVLGAALAGALALLSR
jgi:hypothetical protein